jgi:hypothetical protein
MMNKFSFIISVLILTFAIVFSGCNQTKYSNEIKIIDNLIVSLDSSEIKLLSIDTENVETKLEFIEEKLKDITGYYKAKKDTIGRKESFIISDYFSLLEPLEEFIPEYKSTIKELKFTKAQLTSLKEDLTNNILKDELAKKHFLIEQSAARDVIIMVDKLQASIGLNTEKLEVIEPRIDSLMIEIKKNQSNK